MGVCQLKTPAPYRHAAYCSLALLWPLLSKRFCFSCRSTFLRSVKDTTVGSLVAVAITMAVIITVFIWRKCRRVVITQLMRCHVPVATGGRLAGQSSGKMANYCNEVSYRRLGSNRPCGRRVSDFWFMVGVYSIFKGTYGNICLVFVTSRFFKHGLRGLLVFASAAVVDGGLMLHGKTCRHHPESSTQNSTFAIPLFV